MNEWLQSVLGGAYAGWSPALRSLLNLLIILALTWAALIIVNRGVRRFRAYMGRVASMARRSSASARSAGRSATPVRC